MASKEARDAAIAHAADLVRRGVVRRASPIAKVEPVWKVKHTVRIGQDKG